MLRTDARARRDVILEHVHAVSALNDAAVPAHIAWYSGMTGGVVILYDDLVADGERGRRCHVHLPRVLLAQEPHHLLGRPRREAGQVWLANGPVGIVELLLRDETEIEEAFRARVEEARVVRHREI